VTNFIQIKDSTGRTILDRGRRICVKQLLPVPDSELVYIIDVDGQHFGPFNKNEWVGVVTARATGGVYVEEIR